MIAEYILASFAVVFLILALVRFGANQAQAKTWLIIGVIFGLVSILLYFLI